MIDVTKISDAELALLLSQLQAERANRVDKRKEEAWRAVRNALHNWIDTYGSIVVTTTDLYEDGIDINEYCDFSTPGWIEQHGEED